jgi:hypothetical protein
MKAAPMAERGLQFVRRRNILSRPPAGSIKNSLRAAIWQGDLVRRHHGVWPKRLASASMIKGTEAPPAISPTRVRASNEGAWSPWSPDSGRGEGLLPRAGVKGSGETSLAPGFAFTEGSARTMPRPPRAEARHYRRRSDSRFCSRVPVPAIHNILSHATSGRA